MHIIVRVVNDRYIGIGCIGRNNIKCGVWLGDVL